MVLPLLGSVRPEVEEIPLQESGCGRGLQGESPGEEQPGAERCSQKEEGALQDLMELAGEGLTLTQWNLAAQKTKEPGKDWLPQSGGEGWYFRTMEREGWCWSSHTSRWPPASLQMFGWCVFLLSRARMGAWQCSSEQF